MTNYNLITTATQLEKIKKAITEKIDRESRTIKMLQDVLPVVIEFTGKTLNKRLETKIKEKTKEISPRLELAKYSIPGHNTLELWSRPDYSKEAIQETIYFKEHADIVKNIPERIAAMRDFIIKLQKEIDTLPAIIKLHNETSEKMEILRELSYTIREHLPEVKR